MVAWGGDGRDGSGSARLTCSVARGVARSPVMCGVGPRSGGAGDMGRAVGERPDACTEHGKERPCSHLRTLASLFSSTLHTISRIDLLL